MPGPFAPGGGSSPPVFRSIRMPSVMVFMSKERSGGSRGKVDVECAPELLDGWHDRRKRVQRAEKGIEASCNNAIPHDMQGRSRSQAGLRLYHLA